MTTLETFLKANHPEQLKRLKKLQREIETDIAYRQDEINRLRQAMSKGKKHEEV